MNVTVVIPARNEAPALPACLQALVDQKTRYTFAVILVDNGSTDGTTDVAQSWQNRLNLQVIHEPIKGRGRARRSGFETAQTEITLSTDADSAVPPDWIEKLVGTLLDSPSAVATTSSSYITDGSRLTNFTMRIGMPLSLKLYRLLVGHYMVTGASFAVRRDAYIAAGGFDPKRDMLDDVDLSFRLARLGKIIYLPKLKIKTEGDVFGNGYLQGFWHYFRHFPPIFRYYRFGAGKFSSKT